MTADTRIIDASALVKLLVREPDSSVFQAHVPDNIRLIAPQHILAETGEVISRKIRAGHVEQDQLALIVSQVEKELELVPVLDLLQPAIMISLKVGASVYDCLYVAAAEKHGCELLTADRRLIARLQGTRFAALLTPLDSFTGSP